MPRTSPQRLTNETEPSVAEAATSSTGNNKKAPYKDMERRREQNRVNAQKSYYRKLVRPAELLPL